MLWQMFVMSYTDLLTNLTVSKDFRQFETQHQELLKYINSEFKRIAKLYSCKVRQLNDRWQLVDVNIPSTCEKHKNHNTSSFSSTTTTTSSPDDPWVFNNTCTYTPKATIPPLIVV
jgi:hypothetical protein